jgi:hypothetical protein
MDHDPSESLLLYYELNNWKVALIVPECQMKTDRTFLFQSNALLAGLPEIFPPLASAGICREK